MGSRAHDPDDPGRREDDRHLTFAERAGWVAFGLAGIAATFLVLYRPVGLDLAVYLAGAGDVVAGHSPYRSPVDPACDAVGCFSYPPPVALLFIPLLALPREVVVWSEVALQAAVAAIVTTVLATRLPRAVRPWAALAVVVFFPLLLELNVANVDVLVVGLGLAAWRMRDRPAASGILLASAIGLKILVAPLAVFYLAAGRARTVLWALAASMVVAFVSAPWVGAYWRDYADFVSAQSVTVGGSTRPEVLAGPAGQAVTIVASLAVAVTSGYLGRGRDERLAHAIALAACPLSTYRIHYTYLLYALPLLFETAALLSMRPALLLLPAASWSAMQAPATAPRFGGLVAAISIGVGALVARRRS